MNVSELLSNMTLTEWEQSQLQGLSIAGVRCLLQNWLSFNENPIEGLVCNATWDNNALACWPAAVAGERLSLACSDVMRFDNRIDPLDLKGEATQKCLHNGTWNSPNQTDYSECLESLDETLRRLRNKAYPFKYVVRYILYYGSFSSILCLLGSLFIFYYFKSIRCDRITVHVNMMLTLLFRCIIIIFMTHPTIFKGSYSFRHVDWFCKLIYSLQFYFTVASIHWMFVQGHFLNSKLTTNIIMKKFPIKTYICIGWGIPLVIIGVWGSVTESFYETTCWKNFGKLPTIWILVVPMTVLLLINVVLLVNILRVVITKTHTANTLTTKTATRIQTGIRIKRGTKATAILFPLLGMANLIFFYNPGGEGQKYYMVANASIQSFQGIVASVLYCFICKDVKDAIRREYYRFKVTQRSSFRRNSMHQTVSFYSRDSKSCSRIQRGQQVALTRSESPALSCNGMNSGRNEDYGDV